MISDTQFTDYIQTLSDDYEDIKDYIFKHVDYNIAGDLLDKIAFFRDCACTALRESHCTENFEHN
jgi:hypothetical protein